MMNNNLLFEIGVERDGGVVLVLGTNDRHRQLGLAFVLSQRAEHLITEAETLR